jgi:hypothetical protein
VGGVVRVEWGVLVRWREVMMVEREEEGKWREGVWAK